MQTKRVFPWGEEDPEGDVARNVAARERLLADPATPEQRAFQSAYMAEVRARSDLGAAALSTRQKRLAFADVQLQAARERLQFLVEREHPERVADEWQRAAWAAACLTFAQVQFSLGEFQSALDWCPEGEDFFRAAFAEYAAADARPDDEECTCEDIESSALVPKRAGDFATPTREPHHLVLGDFPSPRLNCWVYAIRCLVCGELNVRPGLTKSAQRHMAAHASPAPDAESLK